MSYIQSYLQNLCRFLQNLCRFSQNLCWNRHFHAQYLTKFAWHESCYYISRRELDNKNARRHAESAWKIFMNPQNLQDDDRNLHKNWADRKKCCILFSFLL